MKHRIIKRIDFCYGHRLLDYEGKCASLHGHNGLVEIELAAEKLDARGMVHDFSVVKRTVKDFVDNELDHRTLLRADDPLVLILQEAGERIFVMEGNPTAENIAKLIFEFAQSRKLPVAAVRLWETRDSCAEYRDSLPDTFL